MEHAWKGYEQYAWGADELAPRAKRPKQPWGGMGVTLVDSLGLVLGLGCRVMRGIDCNTIISMMQQDSGCSLLLTAPHPVFSPKTKARYSSSLIITLILILAINYTKHTKYYAE